jgi:hypothetical protein
LHRDGAKKSSCVTLLKCRSGGIPRPTTNAKILTEAGEFLKAILAVGRPYGSLFSMVYR